jgi:hypothetical protein
MKQILLFFLIMPSALCAMDIFEDNHKKIRSLFKIFDEMNQLDLTKKDYEDKSQFGELIAYLMNYPLEYWKVPYTETEQYITIKWIKNLYAHKEDRFLHQMIEDIVYKCVRHDELYACIVDLLQPDEEQDIQQSIPIAVYLSFKRQEWMNQQQINYKKNAAKWSCTLL